MGKSEMHVDVLKMHLKILNLHKKVLKSYSLLDFEVKSSSVTNIIRKFAQSCRRFTLVFAALSRVVLWHGRRLDGAGSLIVYTFRTKMIVL